MVRIQTFGLLADIRKRVHSTGDAIVSWTDLEAFAAPMRVKDLPEVLKLWAEENMMWVEFQYEDDRHDLRIMSVIFGSSR